MLTYDIRIKPKPNQTSEQYFAKNNVHRIDEYTHTQRRMLLYASLRKRVISYSAASVWLC